MSQVTVRLAPILAFFRRYQTIWMILLMAGAVVVSRRPDAVFVPQLWAEDGVEFFATAYNGGPFNALFLPYAGSLQTVQRLAAAIACLLPLRHVPIFLNGLAIAIQMLPVVLLWTPRFRRLVPDARARALLTFVYLALPNSAEVNATITNANWYLALVAVMILVAPAPATAWARWFDRVVLVLIALSGPFSFFLFPVALVRWVRGRGRGLLERALVLLAGAVVQGVVLVLNPRTFGDDPTTGLMTTVRIVDGQLFLAPLMGTVRAQRLLARPDALLIGVLVVGILLTAYGLWKGPPALRLLALFSGLMLCTTLFQPTPHGILMAGAAGMTIGNGGRYFLASMLTWMSCLVWMMWRGWVPLRVCAWILVAGACAIGIPSDWRHPAFVDYGYQTNVERFQQVPQGTRYDFALNPKGWHMVLVKR